MDRAYFLRKPRRIEELWRPHLPGKETPFEIVRRISLGRTDYDNFTQDMLVCRGFLTGMEMECSFGEISRCLFIHAKGKRDGVLVAEIEEGCVRVAALWTQKETQSG